MPYRNLFFTVVSAVSFLAVAIVNDIYWVGNYAVLVLGFLSFGTLLFPRVGYSALMGTLAVSPVALILALTYGNSEIMIPYFLLALVAGGGLSLISYMRPEYQYNYRLVYAR